MRKEIHVIETTNGLKIFFPVYEIYEDGRGYVESVKNAFVELKSKYTTVGVVGLVYYYYPVSDLPDGFYFHCEPGDIKLSISQKWQKCCICGRVITEDE